MGSVGLYEAKTAELSPCGRYRYSLGRRWFDDERKLQRVCWLMLNPSTADAEFDDATIRRVVRFSFRWGFASLEVVNLFAWRATDPTDLKSAADPVGARNDAAILKAVHAADLVVCAWGVFGCYLDRGVEVATRLRSEGVTLNALGHTKGGQPRHPLRLSYSERLVELRKAA